MRTLKSMGLGAMTLLVFAATGHATTATSPSGTAYSGTVIAQSLGSTSFNGAFVTVTCNKAIIQWKVEKYGAGVTAEGKASSLTFTECNSPVTVLKAGFISKHATFSGNATVTGTGQEIVIHGSVGACFFTSNTHLGEIKGGAPAMFPADGTYVRTGGSFLCGSSMRVTGTYGITTPSSLSFD